VDARRETDVSDNFLDSAWYYLRYPSTDRHDLPFDAERTRRWLPVSMYVGGNEHAVLHLLYTRFISMALHDMGWLPMEEPFASFRAHGLLLRDGRKMSKSRGNVVNPDDYLDRYGADVFRLHLMFFGDFARGGDFQDENIVGIERFVQRLWRYALTTSFADGAPANTALCALVREKVRRVTTDVERLHYNTAVAAVMELLQALVAAGSREGSHVRTLLVLLQPFAPFVAHELWERLGGAGLACDAPWPEGGEPEGAASVTYAIQVDGRLRDTMVLPPGACREEAVAAALSRERVKGALAGRTPTRAVHIPDRIVNLVTGGS
jgi:leucyl-tRNA synthetase